MRTKAPQPKMDARSFVANGKRVTTHEDSGSETVYVGPKLLKHTHPKTNATVEVNIGDCRKVLSKFNKTSAGTIDLIFADPPFNWNRGYDHWDDSLPRDEYLKFTYDWLDECVRALKPGGSLWVNIPDDWAAQIVCYLTEGMRDPENRTQFREPAAVMSMPNWCIWHYRFGQNTVDRFINSKVHALWFVKPNENGERPVPTWNAKEVLEVSDRAAIYGDPRTLSKKDGMPPGRRVPMDVWYGQYWGRVQGNNTERRNYHDNQLPEVYLERVIRACSNAGEKVMDPFLGSGTTGVVAAALGRNFVGCEFSPINAKHAMERIKAGPVRVMGGNEAESTAIFKSRRKTGEKKVKKNAE